MESFRNFDQEKGYFLRGLSHLLNLPWINNYYDVVMTSLSHKNINGSEKYAFTFYFFNDPVLVKSHYIEHQLYYPQSLRNEWDWNHWTHWNSTRWKISLFLFQPLHRASNQIRRNKREWQKIRLFVVKTRFFLRFIIYES